MIATKVTVCHQAGQSGKYTTNTVDVNSIFKKGHGSHPGDIIPPFSYEEGGEVHYYSGLNWDEEGIAIYENACVKPTPQPDPDPEPTPDDPEDEEPEEEPPVEEPEDEDETPVEDEHPDPLPPEFECPEGTVPGWLGPDGEPTSCINDNATPPAVPEIPEEVFKEAEEYAERVIEDLLTEETTAEVTVSVPTPPEAVETAAPGFDVTGVALFGAVLAAMLVRSARGLTRFGI